MTDSVIPWTSFSFRSLVARIRHFRFDPATDPVLRELAQRAVTFAANGYLVSCRKCGGSGPVNGVAVLYAQPLNEGGQQNLDNAAAWCFGCVRDEGRTDYLIASRVPVRRPASPIAVIECGESTDTLSSDYAENPQRAYRYGKFPMEKRGRS